MKTGIRLLAMTSILVAMTAWDVAPIGCPTPAVEAAAGARFSTLAGTQASPVLANGKIAYVSEKRENNSHTYTIHSINPDGSNRLQLTSGPGDFAPLWSPDGSQIVFMRDDGQRSEIVVMNADGSDQRGLTPPDESDHSPSWSPDGKQLAFVRTFKEGDSRRGQVFTMNADGSNPRRLTHSAESDNSPLWSPDGEKLAFLRTSLFGSSLFVIGADGDEKRVGDVVFGFSWSPDGSRLSVSSYEIGLYIVNADGTEPKTITYPRANNAFDVEYDTLPAWSGDGSKIAFTRFLGCNIELVDCKSEQLWVINADGSGARQLTENGSAASASMWSPDSRRILSYDTDLVVIDPDEGKITNITNTTDVREFSPSWQPLLATGCAESVSPADAHFGADGGTGSIEVNAGNECGWTAISNVGWISITSGSGVGNGSISYSVAANDRTSSRTARFAVARHIVTVTQAGAPVRIFSVQIEGKQLFVLGEHFDPGAVILLNGEEQRTRPDGTNPATTLIGKKAGKKLKPGDKLQVRNTNGSVSEEFTFTPLGKGI